MQTIEPPVSRALVLVCEKCGKRLKRDDDENPSRELVSRLKKKSKKLFDKGEVRALATSCMDICPDDQVSVAITTFRGKHPGTRFFTLDLDDVDETSQNILRELEAEGDSG
jgi:predicted metal-binding protein